MFILILSVLAMISLLLWRYQDTIRERVGRSASPKTIRRDRPKDAGKKGRDSSDSRREFVFTLDRVRKQLKRALVLDREQTQKETLLEIAARLTMIEKRAKLDDKRLPELIEQLGRVQEENAALFPKTKPEERKREAEQRDSEKQHDSSRKRSENKRGSDQHESSTDGPSKKKTTPDYFQILGVGKNVTADELKKAYRQKMREYHPDKHSASDFAWIKEEADRQTKLIREAYDALSDGMK
jgi:DnaJ-domain-containing protein 1